MRRSAPAALLPLSNTKTAAIYPELNKDTEPKPLPPVLAVEELVVVPTPPGSTLPGPPVSTVPPPESLSTGVQPSVVTCGNVQISMPQSPQTIQINQWNQEKHVVPNSGLLPDQQASRLATNMTQQNIPQSVSSQSAPLKPNISSPNLPSTPPIVPSSYQPPSQSPVDLRQSHVKPSRSDGSLKITDVYEGTPPPSSSQFATPPSSSSSQYATPAQYGQQVPTPSLSSAGAVPNSAPQSTSSSKPNMVRLRLFNFSMQHCACFNPTLSLKL